MDFAALALVGGLLLTMPLFAIVSRHRTIDADVARRSRTILLGRWIRDWLMWVIGPVERGMVRAGVSPDALNYLGVVLAFSAGAAFTFEMLGAGGWLILLRPLCGVVHVPGTRGFLRSLAAMGAGDGRCVERLAARELYARPRRSSRGQQHGGSHATRRAPGFARTRRDL